MAFSSQSSGDGTTRRSHSDGVCRKEVVHASICTASTSPHLLHTCILQDSRYRRRLLCAARLRFQRRVGGNYRLLLTPRTASLLFAPTWLRYPHATHSTFQSPSIILLVPYLIRVHVTWRFIHRGQHDGRQTAANRRGECVRRVAWNRPHKCTPAGALTRWAGGGGRAALLGARRAAAARIQVHLPARLGW